MFLLESCITNNLLMYKHKRHVHEFNRIQENNSFVLRHNIKKQEPRATNFDYWHIFEIEVLDSAKFKNKAYVDLSVDTLIVRPRYYRFIPLSLKKENNIIVGKIYIENWNNDEINLKENITINDILRNKKLRLKGTRTFTR